MPNKPAKTGSKKSTDRVVKHSPVQSSPRRLAVPKRHVLKPKTWLRNLPAPERTPLPKARIIAWRVSALLWHQKKLFGGICVIYAFLTIVLVRGLASTDDLSSFKSLLDSSVNGASGKAISTGASFLYLLATSGGGSGQSAGAYQIILFVMISLAFIWALRQVAAKSTPRIRDTFYLGLYPIVPFILIFMVIAVQLIPLGLAGSLYTLVVTNGIANDIGEKLLFGTIFAGFGLWSLRMITSSIFALYIVTLPNMTPFAALRSAKKLVYKRRLLIWRKLIMLPVISLLVAAIIEIPLILFWTPGAEWAFFILSTVGLAAAHGYMYGLYRELL